MRIVIFPHILSIEKEEKYDNICILDILSDIMFVH